MRRPVPAVLLWLAVLIAGAHAHTSGTTGFAAVRWLVREERTTAVPARIPVPPLVLLTQGQARGIFAFLVVLLPLSVIALGGLIGWRRR